MISVPPMMIAHPAAHYPQMPWAAAGPDGALQPVFLANPAEYQQMMQQQRPGSVDSESSKSSSRRGSLSKSGNDYNKFVPSMKKMQLGEYFLLQNFIIQHKINSTKFKPFFQLKLRRWRNKPIECESLKRRSERDALQTAHQLILELVAFR